MTVRAHIVVFDKGSTESLLLAELLGDIEQAARYAAVDALRQFSSEYKFSQVATDAASFRVLFNPESIFWVEDIGNGSKWIKGIFLTAIISAVLRSTVGVSIEDGWRETHAHQVISEQIPKLEQYFIEAIERRFGSDRPSRENQRYDIVRVAIVREREDTLIQIEVDPRRMNPLAKD